MHRSPTGLTGAAPFVPGGIEASRSDRALEGTNHQGEAPGNSTRSKVEVAWRRCEVCGRQPGGKALPAGWGECHCCGLTVHLECYCEQLTAGPSWLCERCLHGRPAGGVSCELCNRVGGAMKRIQPSGEGPEELPVLCNHKEGFFLVMGEKVRTTDGRVITPVAFVRETGSRTKNWRMAITLASNGSSLRDALESRWAHVWCTEQDVSSGVQSCMELAIQDGPPGRNEMPMNDIDFDEAARAWRCVNPQVRQLDWSAGPASIFNTERDDETEEAPPVAAKKKSSLSPETNHRLSVGNAWEKSPIGSAKPYVFTLFVRGKDANVVRSGSKLGIEKVVFHLHPDFSPSSISVSKSPFETTLLGWCGFDATAIVHMLDGGKQKVTFVVNAQKALTWKVLTIPKVVVDEDDVDGDGEIFECEFGCGFESPSRGRVEAHETFCVGNTVEKSDEKTKMKKHARKPLQVATGLCRLTQQQNKQVQLRVPPSKPRESVAVSLTECQLTVGNLWEANSDNEDQPHRWTLFVRGEKPSVPDVSSSGIEKVVFHLPDSTPPTLTVMRSPFEITQCGKAELEARVVIYMADNGKQQMAHKITFHKPMTFKSLGILREASHSDGSDSGAEMYECEFGCGFESLSRGRVEAHETFCVGKNDDQPNQHVNRKSPSLSVGAKSPSGGRVTKQPNAAVVPSPGAVKSPSTGQATEPNSSGKSSPQGKKRQRKSVSKLTVGNTWETSASDGGSSKWTLFVRGEDPSVEDASRLGIAKVAFHLDSQSERITPTVTVTSSPFSVSQHGTESFDVRVVIYMIGGREQEMQHTLNCDQPKTFKLVRMLQTAEDTVDILSPAEPAARELQTSGHQWIKKRVLRMFGKERVGGIVTGWMPPDPNNLVSEPALFHVKHDDGDEEDLDEEETAAAIEACIDRVDVKEESNESKDSASLGNSSGIAPYSCDYCGRGLKNAGSKVNHQKACQMKPPDKHAKAPATKERTSVTSVKPQGAVTEPASKNSAPFSCDYCGRGLQTAGAKVNHEKACALKSEVVTRDLQTSGHQWIKKRVLRMFGKERVGGIVTGWMPPDPNNLVSEPALFHVKHDDGDEEDLDEEETAAAIEACRDRTEGQDRQAKRQRKSVSKLTVGNTWETSASDGGSSKWTLFVRGEDPSVEDASDLGITKVAFHLDSEFLPPIVTVTSSPFSVSRYGEDSFDAKVTIYMTDGRKQEMQHTVNCDQPMTFKLMTTGQPLDNADFVSPPDQPDICQFQSVCWECKRGKLSHKHYSKSQCRILHGHTGVDWRDYKPGQHQPKPQLKESHLHSISRTKAAVVTPLHPVGQYPCDFCGRGLQNAGAKRNHEKACAMDFKHVTKCATDASKRVDDAPAVPHQPEAVDEEWQTSGHQWIKKRVLRMFGKERVGGIVTGWMPPDPNNLVSEPALFHVKHDDGDEEDLDEEETAAAIEACRKKNAGDQTELSGVTPGSSDPYSCDYCGRGLKNAGSKVNHERSCSIKHSQNEHAKAPATSQEELAKGQLAGQRLLGASTKTSGVPAALRAMTAPWMQGSKVTPQGGAPQEMPYSCDYCGRGLQNAGSKVNHERACSIKKSKRKHAKMPTTSRAELTLVTPQGGGPQHTKQLYSCDYCGRGLHNAGSKANHERGCSMKYKQDLGSDSDDEKGVVAKSEAASCICDYCGRKLGNAGSKVNHERSCALKRQNELSDEQKDEVSRVKAASCTCDYCGRKLGNAGSKVNHERSCSFKRQNERDSDEEETKEEDVDEDNTAQASRERSAGPLVLSEGQDRKAKRQCKSVSKLSIGNTWECSPSKEPKKWTLFVRGEDPSVEDASDLGITKVAFHLDSDLSPAALMRGSPFSLSRCGSPPKTCQFTIYMTDGRKLEMQHTLNCDQPMTFRLVGGTGIGVISSEPQESADGTLSSLLAAYAAGPHSSTDELHLESIAVSAPTPAELSPSKGTAGLGERITAASQQADAPTLDDADTIEPKSPNRVNETQLEPSDKITANTRPQKRKAEDMAHSELDLTSNPAVEGVEGGHNHNMYEYP